MALSLTIISKAICWQPRLISEIRSSDFNFTEILRLCAEPSRVRDLRCRLVQGSSNSVSKNDIYLSYWVHAEYFHSHELLPRACRYIRLLELSCCLLFCNEKVLGCILSLSPSAFHHLNRSERNNLFPDDLEDNYYTLFQLAPGFISNVLYC